MKRNLVVPIALVFTVAILVYGVSRSRGISQRQRVDTTDGRNVAAKSAPDFELKALDGGTVKLSDFRGKAVVLNFWATYCAPCRVEMPWLIDFYQRYKAQGLEIIGVSMDDGNQERVDAFAKETNVNYTILLGNHSVGDAYGGARFLPQTFLIDRDGRIVTSLIGIKTKGDFEDSIQRLLATQSQTR
jgi:cytochrome c biogenesis protein CcmG/thiol:disulfide interchange protein DsbE